jgi:hypothetical protein
MPRSLRLPFYIFRGIRLAEWMLTCTIALEGCDTLQRNMHGREVRAFYIGATNSVVYLRTDDAGAR